MISIVLLNWNGKTDTLHCLDSLTQVTSPPFETILVDNGSSDDSVAAIRERFPRICIIETGNNLGFAAGNNVGIREALHRGADFILLLNNDTLVDPNLLNAFLMTAQDNPHAGILGAKNYLLHAPDQLDHFGGLWNRKKGQFDLIGYRLFDDGKSWEEPLELDYVCGCSLFSRREVFETIGLLEEKFFLIWEESDFCVRARRAGFAVMTAPQAKIWHKVSASFKSKPQATYFWWRNRLLWIERNCALREKSSLLFRVLIPEIFKLWKRNILKTTQLHLFPSKTKEPERLRQLHHYRAALRGVKDYCLRRFGNTNKSK
jgi:GT2 family glycosyltransferase